MKVKLLTGRVTDTGRPQKFGAVLDVTADEASRLIAAGQAWPVEQPKPTPQPQAGAKPRR